MWLLSASLRICNLAFQLQKRCRIGNEESHIASSMTKLNKIKLLLHFRGDTLHILLCFKTQGKPFQIESIYPKADKISIKIPLDPDCSIH